MSVEPEGRPHTVMGTWCRIAVLGPDGEKRGSWSLSGPRDPDLAVVDYLASLYLHSQRRGGRLVVTDACEPLLELLELAGLRREVVGEAEGREEKLGVEESVKPGDASG